MSGDNSGCLTGAASVNWRLAATLFKQQQYLTKIGNAQWKHSMAGGMTIYGAHLLY